MTSLGESFSTLTDFGKQLSAATKSRINNFDSSTKSWPDLYQYNASYITSLQKAINSSPNVLLVGAGRHHDLEHVKRSTKGWLRSGVHWTNFNPFFPVDIVVSTHCAPLEASLHSFNKPSLLIHGVYSKVPPCLKKSLTVRWSDPFLLPKWNGNPTAAMVNSLLEAKAFGVAPYIPAVRNTLFLNAMIMLWLGAKQLVFTAVDPHNPEYFFSGDNKIILEIVKSLSQCDPWLAEWDGRNERIPELKRSTSHRIQSFTKALLQARSAVGGKDYLIEFDRGFKLLEELAVMRGASLAYIGKSSYMETTNIKRIS